MAIIGRLQQALPEKAIDREALRGAGVDDVATEFASPIE